MALSTAASTPPPRKYPLPVIGIAGGIGSGKSAVARWVAEHANVLVLNADQLGHEALQADSVKQALCERFGKGILNARGDVDRAAVAQLVFGTDEKHVTARHDLEKIVHPEIGRRSMKAMEQAAADGQQAVLMDAAVMLEAGWRSRCDLVVFIDASDEDRLNRVQTNRGWTAEELRRREASQWSLAEKRKHSDVIVSNHGDLQTAGRQLLEFLRERGIVH